MAIHRLNHAVLFVRSVDASVAFYTDVLGFGPAMGESASPMPGAAFLRAPASSNDHDLGLFEIGSAAAASGAGRTSVGLYHLAWEVETLSDLEDLQHALASAGALVGASDHGTTKSLYGRDPDGLEFELCWIIPADLLDDAALAGRTSTRPLDLRREMERYGAQTPGGFGVSRFATKV